jgi:Bacterial PH domain
MPVKYFDDQLDDEEVLFVFRKHPVVMRMGLILGMLGPLVGVVPALIRPDLGMAIFFGGLAAGCVLGALIFFPSWIGWYYSVFIVTDQRFIQISQKGMFKRSLVDISLSQVQIVNYEVSGFQETLLGFGTIMMQTYMGDLVIHDVHHPARIQKKILSILREKGIINTAYPGAGNQ